MKYNSSGETDNKNKIFNDNFKLVHVISFTITPHRMSNKTLNHSEQNHSVSRNRTQLTLQAHMHKI
jgi:hypothetical protein